LGGLPTSLSLTRVGGLTATLILLAILTSASFYVDSETPEKRQNAAVTSNCEPVDREPNGYIAQAINGDWYQSSAVGAHPLSDSLGSGRRVYLFRDDGTSHLWWSVKTKRSNDGGNQPLRWTVENGNLIVNDLPPAVVEIGSGAALIRT